MRSSPALLLRSFLHIFGGGSSGSSGAAAEESGAQPGLYFVPTARLGGNALDRQKAAKEAQREAVRLGDAAPPPMPPMDSMPEKIPGFRSPRASPKAGGSVAKRMAEAKAKFEALMKSENSEEKQELIEMLGAWAFLL